jgi:hypothetical protein
VLSPRTSSVIVFHTTVILSPLRRAIARAPRRAARRRESANTLLVADPPTALAVTAEGASCAARAVPSGSVSCMLAARHVPTDRFVDGVPGAGREPSVVCS